MNRILLCCLLCLLACSDPSPAMDAGQDAGSDAPMDSAVMDAGDAPDALVDATIDAAPDSSMETMWNEEPAYPVPVDHHTTAIVALGDETFLYVFGGWRTVNAMGREVHPDIRRAPIDLDGRLGEWEAIGSFPDTTDGSDVGIAYQAQIVRQDDATGATSIWQLGGIVGTEASNASATPYSLIATINEDGTIQWSLLDARFEAPRLHATAEHLRFGDRDQTFVIGGLRAGQPSASVLALAADESAWAESTPLPTPRSHHVSVVYEGAMVVAGGFDDMRAPVPDVIRSQHDEDGNLTGWETIGTLENAPWAGSAFVEDDALWLVGGGVGSSGAEAQSALVLRATWGAEGLGAFEEAFSLPFARSHVHQTPVYAGHLYSVGGRIGTEFSGTERTISMPLP